MADNYLITGYWGEPHVTAENDRGINAAMFGTGRFVLPVGEQFKAEYIGNNTIRMYDGKLMNNGAAAGIPAGEYIDLLIPEAGQGMNRNDLIVFQYSQDASTLIESGKFVVIHGVETDGTASDPLLTQEDLLSGKATFDQMALWRVPVSGTVISSPVQLFDVSKNIKNAGSVVVEATSSDGVAYSATVPGVTELYAGLEITIIPQVESTSETITLDVNGLGAKNVRLPLSSNTTTLVMPAQPNYYTAGRPVKMRYDATWLNKGAWVVAERQRTSGNDLYGSVPVQNGGIAIDNNTTDEDKAEALENLNALGAVSMKKLWENADPWGEFPEQSVSINASGYDYIAIDYMVSSIGAHQTQKCKVGETGVLSATFGTGDSGSVTGSTWYSVVRQFTVSATAVNFKNAYRNKRNSTTVTNDVWLKALLPHRIYGIKGVL